MSEKSSLKPKKVLYIINDFTGGGAERSIIELALEMRKRGWSPFFVTLLKGGEYLDTLVSSGIDHFCLDLRSLSVFFNFIRLVKILFKEKFSLIVSFLYWSNMLSRFIGKAFNVPVINGMRNTDLWRKKFHIFLDRYTFSMAQVYVSNSEAARIRLMSIEKLDPDKIRVIKNGISQGRFKDKNIFNKSDKEGVRKSFFRSLTALDGTCVKRPGFAVGYSGRLTEVKNPIGAVEAFSIFKKQRPDSVLVIAGKGPLRSEVAARCRELGIADSVIMTGFIDNISEFYISLDLYVQTSFWEGLPNTVLEAMYFGIPVAACESGGTSELVIHSETGFMINSHIPQHIAEKWIHIADDKALAALFSMRSVIRVKRYFTFNGMIDKYEFLFNKMLGL